MIDESAALPAGHASQQNLTEKLRQGKLRKCEREALEMFAPAWVNECKDAIVKTV